MPSFWAICSAVNCCDPKFISATETGSWLIPAAATAQSLSDDRAPAGPDIFTEQLGPESILSVLLTLARPGGLGEAKLGPVFTGSEKLAGPGESIKRR